MNPTVVLVVAKAPETGVAKTRLTPPLPPEQAAKVAAASLLDTLAAVHGIPGIYPVVAWTGEIERACRRDAIEEAMADMDLVWQRGGDFGERLAAAHTEVAERYPASPVLQIGMDTPQLTPELLAESAAPLRSHDGPEAVLGPALDGGWWALGLREPRDAEVLGHVPMSRPDTGKLTGSALAQRGLRVHELVELSDVDTVLDAHRVAESAPETEFAAALRESVEREGAV
ncbi:TIGR04282 family arsenosugar biosynthesis glycosyltransferase [Actinopolyspora sp. H202]|uniref:TIGR04282 family arsenosugar biosynthesis glycosyltransferase n=1 Tax=Actinopolyspora sp. H202 TaxID=1500456 RepID=UPI003EE6BD11